MEHNRRNATENASGVFAEHRRPDRRLQPQLPLLRGAAAPSREEALGVIQMTYGVNTL